MSELGGQIKTSMSSKGRSKKKKIINVTKNDDAATKEMVTGFENGKFVTKESKELEEKKRAKDNLVIPLIDGWDHLKKKSETGSIEQEKQKLAPSMEEKAVEALVKQAKGETYVDEEKDTNTDAIPLLEREKADETNAPMLIRNMIPGLRDIDDPKQKLMRDMDLRPEAPEAKPEAYKIAIEDFGAAMLRGMNWTPETGVGVGKNQKVVKPVLFQNRPSGLGLGAVAKPDELNKRKIKKTNSGSWLGIGSLVRITQSPHENEYGVVLQIEGVPGLDNILVQISPGSDAQQSKRLPEVRIRRKAVELLNPKTIPKQHVGHLLLRQSKEQHLADLKEAERKRNINTDRAKAPENKGYEPNGSKKRKDDHLSNRTDGRDKKRYRSKDRSQSKRKTIEKKKKRVCWLQPGMRVRIVSKSLGNGSHYAQKGTVMVVTSSVDCTCSVAMVSGIVLDEVSQRQVETALPKPQGKILVVLGKYKGEKGKLLERNSRKNEAVVQFSSDFSIHKFGYEQVAEYCFDDENDD